MLPQRKGKETLKKRLNNLKDGLIIWSISVVRKWNIYTDICTLQVELLQAGISWRKQYGHE